MLTATVLAIFMVPLFYVGVRRLFSRDRLGAATRAEEPGAAE
jgi:hypothetical protein